MQRKSVAFDPKTNDFMRLSSTTKMAIRVALGRNKSALEERRDMLEDILPSM